MGSAFEHAHLAVRAALVAKYEQAGAPLEPTPEDFLLEADDGQPIDGGATATVVALLQGHLLVIANVGDSDCLLGGLLPDGSIGFEQLCADHTPMSVDEYIRVARLTEVRRRRSGRPATLPVPRPCHLPLPQPCHLPLPCPCHPPVP